MTERDQLAHELMAAIEGQAERLGQAVDEDSGDLELLGATTNPAIDRQRRIAQSSLADLRIIEAQAHEWADRTPSWGELRTTSSRAAVSGHNCIMALEACWTMATRTLERAVGKGISIDSIGARARNLESYLKKYNKWRSEL